MKELTLKELQQESLRVMKIVDEWCVRNGVKYTLCGGSLIGAARHKGFIPWDDDIDIAIPRNEYQHLVNEFCIQGGVKVLAPELGNSWQTFGRVCDTEKTFHIPYCPWTNVPNEQVGIYIDIIPIDVEPDDDNEYVRHMTKILETSAKYYQIRGAQMPFRDVPGLIRKFKWIGKKVLYGGYNVIEWRDKLLAMARRYSDTQSSYCGNMSFPLYELKERHRAEIFSEYTRLPFEDANFSVVSRYDEYLRDIFGNYMELPPVSEQVPKHREHRFFWKD